MTAKPSDTEAIGRTLTAPRFARWLTACAMLALVGCSGEPPEPTPTPPAHTSAPAPSVGPDGRALPGFVTIAEDLPGADVAPEGLLERAEPGWALAIYRPSVLPRSTDAPTATATTPSPTATSEELEATYQVVYLATTTGERYQLLELPPDPTLRLVDWVAGETSALVLQCGDTCDTGTHATLDLTTGTLTPVEGVPTGVTVPSLRAGDLSFWSAANPDPSQFLTPGASYVLRDGVWNAVGSEMGYFPLGVDNGASPDDRYIALGRVVWSDEGGLSVAPSVLDVESLEVLAPALSGGAVDCRAARWLDAHSLAVECTLQQPSFIWHLDDGTIEPLSDTGFVQGGTTRPRVYPVYTFQDGLVVGNWVDDDPAVEVGVNDGGVLTRLAARDLAGEPLPFATILDRAGSTVSIGANTCTDWCPVTSVHLWAVGSLEPVLVFPEVTAWDGSDADPELYKVESLTAVVLGR